MRLADSKKGTSIYRDANELLGNFANCEVNSSDSPTFAWPKYNSAIQLIHSNFNIENPSEWDEFRQLAKKTQASRMQVDVTRCRLECSVIGCRDAGTHPG